MIEKHLLFCPVCERKTKSGYIGEYRGKSELFNENALYQCTECKIIFSYPLPTPSELDKYYKTNWLHDEDIVSASEAMEMIYQILGKVRCDYLLRHQILSEGAKVLDIGSGKGSMFQSIRNLGLKEMSFYATDPSPISLQNLRALGVKAFDSINEVSEKNFDLVTLGQVLEHIPNPYSYLKSIIGLVKNGGHIYIDVPDRDDENKALLEPHVLVFSNESLQNLGEKLKLKTVHITSFGVKRKNFIPPLNLIHRVLCRTKKELRAMLSIEPKNEQLKKWLIDLYQFEREDKDGCWWTRVVFKVEQ